MNVDAVATLHGRVFRAGTAFDLIVFDRLPLEEQAALMGLRADPNFYGILRPRPGTGRTIKSVSRDTALLWLTLQSPGPLPFFATGDGDEGHAAAVWQFVLDGVLEMQTDSGFVAGAQAAEVLSNGRRSLPEGRLARLSALALRYGERLRLEDPQQLAGWLYGFGSQPLSPRWQHRLPDRDAVLAFVGAGPGTALGRRLDIGWDAGSEELAPGWLAWSSRARSDTGAGKVAHKLYVSPAIDAMPLAFEAVLDVLSTRAAHFKIGGNAAGLLRPDKMVIYFRDQASLLAAASALSARLSGVAAHGVPFSAEITPDGLMSWGMDPPRSERRLAWQEPESWRLWVVRRLAAAMVAAQSDLAASMTPAEFAMERLRHEGVDVNGWTPSGVMWHNA
jgi:hypothetical protein